MYGDSIVNRRKREKPRHKFDHCNIGMFNNGRQNTGPTNGSYSPSSFSDSLVKDQCNKLWNGTE